MHRQFLITLLREIIEKLGIRIGSGHRLFQVAVLAGFQDFQGHRHMQVVVQADIDRINVVPLEHLTEVGVKVLDLVFFAPGFQLLLIDIAGSDHLGIWNLRVAFHMLSGDYAGSDQGNTDFFHF